MNEHKLELEAVDEFVPNGAVGAYVLSLYGNDGKTLRYVGRSDVNLRRRLKDHAQEGRFSTFVFEVTDTIYEAYQMECREWHRFPAIVNQIHPDAPNGLPYVCSYCLAAEAVRFHFRQGAI